MRKKSIRLFITIICFASIVSCGGSGDSGGPSPTPTPPANSPPSFTSATEFTFAENQVVQFVVSVSDPDGDTVTITETSGGDGGLFQLDANTGQVTALTANSQFNFEDPLDSDRDNVYVQSFNLNDGTTNVTETITVTITNVIEQPRYLGSSDFEAEEGIIGFAISATDDDFSVLEYSLAGTDADEFMVANGNLNFIQPPNFESPADADMNNVYEVVLSIANSEASIDVDLTATISNVDEAPICTSAESFTFDENAIGEIYRFSATDPEGDAFTFENLVITAENQLFDNISFNPETGSVTLLNAVDFEALSDPSGTLSVSAGDSTCNTEFTVLNVTGTVMSGLKLLRGALAAEPIGDVDGDSIQDLWLTSQTDDVLEGVILFGNYLSNAMPAGTLDINNAAANETLLIKISTSSIVGNASDMLTARAIGDVDGDGIDELLIGFSDCDACPSNRMMAYLVWGSTIQNDTTGTLVLDELGANQVLPLPFQSQASSKLSFTSADFDGDGRADIAFGLPTPVEESFIVFGDYLASAKSSGTVDLVQASQAQVLDLNIDFLSFPFAGEHMTSIEDLSGDGFPELVLTSTQWVHVVYSSTISNGRTTGNLNLGSSFDLEINATSGVASLSQQPFDLDGDGIPEIAWTGPVGELASIAIGSTFSSTPNAKYIDDTVNFLSSNAITSINDLSGGGVDELVMSLRTSLSPELNEIRIITGEVLSTIELGFFADLSTLAPGEVLSINGLASQDSLSKTVASIEDLDGDGLNELIVSDIERGETYIIRGADIAQGLDSGITTLDMNALFNNET